MKAPFLLLAAGIGIMAFPFLAGAVSQAMQDRRNAAYLEAVTNEFDSAKEKEAAERYNRMIALEQKKTPFSYRGEQDTDPVYEALLNGPDGQMGILAVPSAGIRLPVMHGTAVETLAFAAGHMYGTSLPVGGAGSHCVLAGHTGMPTARLFTGLKKVREGEEVFLYILGEVHCYVAVEIRIVVPEEESEWLQVEEGEDLLTLYTCTPEGINDHRLLVRCRRTLPDPEQNTSGEAYRTQGRRQQENLTAGQKQKTGADRSAFDT